MYDMQINVLLQFTNSTLKACDSINKTFPNWWIEVLGNSTDAC